MMDKSLKSHLAENPRLTGALFTLMVLLTQVGSVLGGNGQTLSGP